MLLTTASMPQLPPIHPTAPLPPLQCAEAPSLVVRLAQTPQEVQAAQSLRYMIFYEERGALASPALHSHRLDQDLHDAACDHLLVFDGPQVVGTYRLLRQSVADAHGGFYSASEFDLSPLLNTTASSGGQLLELGRSCVAPAYRNSRTISLLWRGIARYLEEHRISHMFGCASFEGTDPAPHQPALAYLHERHLAPPALRARALSAAPCPILGGYDERTAQRALPPLIKGYLRVGAMVGEGIYVDHTFNTVDIFVVMPVQSITRRYLDRFTPAIS